VPLKEIGSLEVLSTAGFRSAPFREMGDSQNDGERKQAAFLD
jgi:hypothetical protein